MHGAFACLGGAGRFGKPPKNISLSFLKTRLRANAGLSCNLGGFCLHERNSMKRLQDAIFFFSFEQVARRAKVPLHGENKRFSKTHFDEKTASGSDFFVRAALFSLTGFAYAAPPWRTRTERAASAVCYSSPSVSPADDSDGPVSPRALAAKNRIKVLLNTVKRLEEERGLALRRLAALEAAPAPLVDDSELARLLVGVLPRVGNRNMPAPVLAVVLALRSRPLAVKGLRDALRVPQATASDWLKDAVKAGVVELHGDEKDKRLTLARLSPKGLRYFRDVRRAPDADAHDADAHDASEG